MLFIFPIVRATEASIAAAAFSSPSTESIIAAARMAAIIQGGLGVAAGGNINPEGASMFEPMGGSAPKYTNQNVINPLAAINAGAMMLEFLGESKAAAAVEQAVLQVLTTKIKSLAAGKMGYGTKEVGDLVAGAL